MGISKGKHRDYDKELWAMVGARPDRDHMLDVFDRLIAQQKAIRALKTSPLAHFRDCLATTAAHNKLHASGGHFCGLSFR